MITLIVMGATALILPLLALAMILAAARGVCGPWDRVTPERARAALGGMRLPGEPLNDPYARGLVPYPRIELPDQQRGEMP